MNAWMWIGFGLLLGLIEIMADTAFYLIFFGLAALMVGFAVAGGLGGPLWVQWVLFSALAIVLVVAFRRRLYEKVRGETVEIPHALIGTRVSLNQALRPDHTVRITALGTEWEAVNTDDEPLEAGSQPIVHAMNGIIAKLTK